MYKYYIIKLRNLVLFSIISILIGNSTDATIITFDPAPLPGGAKRITNYSESGVLLTGTFSHGSSLNDNRASNDSSGYLEIKYPGSFRIEMANTSLFNLEAVDLSEYSILFIAPKSITFTGYYADLTSVSQTFVTDGLFDSIGGIDDFETFQFDPAFINLLYVESSTITFSMDNLVIIPEPATLSLILLGGIALAKRRKRRSVRP
jgi:hypothetical protein